MIPFLDDRVLHDQLSTAVVICLPEEHSGNNEFISIELLMSRKPEIVTGSSTRPGYAYVNPWIRLKQLEPCYKTTG